MKEGTVVARTGFASDQDNAAKLPWTTEAVLPWRPCDLRGLLALGLYLLLSVSLFGRVLIGRWCAFHMGVGPDPALMIWFLAWWPHAIAHGLNPFLTRTVWAPQGLNLAWQTSIPLPSLLASPLTLTLGPILSYNILCLVSLPFDAWCAFVLCRYLSRHFWASLLSGYLFGFSAFMLGGLKFGHLHLLLAFPVPLAVYVVMRRLANELTQYGCALLLTVLLIAEFLLSLEIFATMAMFGAFALLLAWSLGTVEMRKQCVALLKPIAYSYGITFILLSPYLYYFFASDFKSAPLFTPASFSADLLNLVIPTQTNELGRNIVLKSVSKRFVGGWLSESVSYMSLPVIALAMLYSCRHWPKTLGKFLTYSLVAIIVASLGPVLHIAGYQFKIALPWWPFVECPVLNNALPGRFVLYAFLLLAIIVSLWFAATKVRLAIKLAVALTIVLLNVPNLSASFWGSAVVSPKFFSNGLYKRYLSRNETIVVFPYGYNGDSMLWQAQSHMYFYMAEGYGASRPEEFQMWPIVDAFVRRAYVPDEAAQLRSFMAAHDVEAIVVTAEAFPTWQKLLSNLGVMPKRIGDIWLYKLPKKRAGDSEVTMREMRARCDVERFSTLAAAAETYLSNGGTIESLSVLNMVERALIPGDSMIGPAVRIDLGAPSIPNVITNPHVAYGMFLEGMDEDHISVGVQAWHDGATSLIERLRGVTNEIYFPYSAKLPSSRVPHVVKGWLVMVFTREQLTHAVTLLKSLPVPELQSQASILPEPRRICSSTAPPSVFP